jgi:outer membrane receptor protein involved in Fe transport
MAASLKQRYGLLWLALAGLIVPAESRAQPAAASAGSTASNTRQPLDLSAIVVKGQASRLRHDSTFTLPASVSRIDGQALESDNLTTTQDLVQRLPNLYLTSFTPSSATIMVRGMGGLGDRSGSSNSMRSPASSARRTPDPLLQKHPLSGIAIPESGSRSGTRCV